MLIVNENSYVDLEYADQYIEDNYPQYDDLAVIWGVLADRDKEAYLRASMGQIEGLVLEGRPYSCDQELQFPRRDCYKTGIIPTEVKDAQVENAIALLNKDISARADEQMKTLGTLGAMKNIKYNKREMGEVGLGSSLTGATSTRVKRLESEDAEKMLKAWL